jgi:hypothetical protein
MVAGNKLKHRKVVRAEEIRKKVDRMEKVSEKEKKEVRMRERVK